MAKVAGRLCDVSYNSASTTYLTLGQKRVTQLTLGGAPIDVTTSDSSNWTELFDAEGVKQATITFTGLVDSDAADALESSLIALRLANTIKSWKFLISLIGTIEADFFITDLSFSAAHDGAAEYSVSLASSGEVAFTAA
jgi:TP901-1 family phage major tail protein